MNMIKSTGFLAVTSLALSSGLYAQQRVTDLELIVNSPAANETYQTHVPVSLIASVMNHGPEDLVSGDTLFIHLPNNTVQPIILAQGIPEGQTAEVINSEITFTMDSTMTFDFCLYLYDDPSNQITIGGGQPISITYLDSDSTNNMACNTFTVTTGESDSSSSIAHVGATDLLLQVYPNPASSWVGFPVNDLGLSDLQVNIIDLAGRLVVESAVFTVSGNGKNAQVRLDLPELKTGMYILEVVGADRKVMGKFSVTY